MAGLDPQDLHPIKIVAGVREIYRFASGLGDTIANFSHESWLIF